MLFSQDELAELPAKFRWGHSAISHILWVTPFFQRKIKEEVEVLGNHLAIAGLAREVSQSAKTVL